jgi:hypothetical protein
MALLDELAQQISSRTGIPADKAEAAARTAVEFLDSRLPAPVGGNLAKLVHGGGEGGGGGGIPDLGKMAGGLGGMLGGK